MESKYRMMNITYEIIQLAGQELQKAAKYQGIEEVESLKFSDNWITAFSRRNKKNVRFNKPWLNFWLLTLRNKREKKAFFLCDFLIFQVTVIFMVFCSAKKPTIKLTVTIKVTTIKLTVDNKAFNSRQSSNFETKFVNNIWAEPSN